MIRIDNVEVYGFEAAARGMRNPMNSWAKNDIHSCKHPGQCEYCPEDDCLYGYDPLIRVSPCREVVGPNDHELMMWLRNAGPEHSKYLRMITVTLDITAPLYWWKEFDTYKVGTVANSCSTMHKIHVKEFTLEDFSHEHLVMVALDALKKVIASLNAYRDIYQNWDTKDKLIRKAFSEDRKQVWWQMIQLLPSSYNQKRTILVNYAVLANMHHQRKHHKLDEWREFCQWIENGLPYSELITGV